ncbi:competence type IV pilus minor pilin ComGF [Jeotgalibacillus terrae]|uniref:Competence type IV pilus minor pilin ComGF n=1 Tax=Jeotgalibacillus terrae TaxID=587735 RepID=A0ABW5ZJH9_9BACL
MCRTKKATGSVLHHNQKGFTMLEVIVSISVLSIIAPLFAMLIFSFEHLMNQQELSKEWDIFTIQFQKEVERLKIESYSSETVTLKNGEASIKFSRQSSLLRRTVDGQGYEIFLTGIDTIRFSAEENLISLEVKFLDGIQKEAIFYTLSPK